MKIPLYLRIYVIDLPNTNEIGRDAIDGTSNDEIFHRNFNEV